MLQLRIKIDSWSRGVPEVIRSRNRELLLDTYMRLPSGRVWYYTQQFKGMQLYHDDGMEMMALKDFNELLPIDAPENTVAEGK